MDWKIALDGFRAYLMLERSLSANSLDAYIRDVAKLQQYLALKNLNYKPTEVPPQVISDLMTYLLDMGLEASSQARTLSGIKTFYKYLLLEDAIDVAPTDLIEAPKLAKRIPDVLTVEEVDRIFAAIDLSQPNGQRNRAILEVLYACGLRVSELVNLKRSNLYFHEGYITVIGKGDKERLVPIGADAMKHVQFYLDHERKQLKKILAGNEDFVFINSRGKPLSRIWIFLIIKELCELAGIEKNVSPHTFRHSFATHLIEGGADLKVVQDLMGHESITTTEVYTHLDTEYLRETIIMFHPRNKRKKADDSAFL
ncbi:MAG: site-specific tyrosine recombinase XerD [Saprospiraceae bacterium]|nr:site-specific tyrosine recombinase XerD [Saprospiraceae bacterium]